MIGEFMWSTGITIDRQDDGKMTVAVHLEDDGWLGDDRPGHQYAITGDLRIRYPQPMNNLASAIDTIKRDAEKLGVRWLLPRTGVQAGKGTVYAERDDLQELANVHAVRIGWEPTYA
jgi:hypothetical protein